MRRHATATVLSVLALALGVCAALAPPAAATQPWTPGTVFVAAQGPRYNDGGVFYTPPGSGLRYSLFNGASEDVVVTAAGVVYWTTCSGNVYKFDPSVGTTLIRSGLHCATGIAVEPDGNLVVSDFYDLYVLSPSGATVSTISSQIEARSIAVDANYNIYFIDQSDNLDVLPSGASTPVQLHGIPYQAQYTSVRLGLNSNLIVGLSGSPGGVLVLPLGGGTATNRSIGVYTYGAVQDTHGNLFTGDLVGNASTIDQVDEFPAGGGAATLVANGYDEPEGMAVWPPVAPPSRTATTTTLSTTSSTSVAAYQSVTLKAQVSAGATGLVQFSYNNGIPLGNAVSVSGGIARLTTTLPKGTDAITATYAGAAGRQPSQSSSITFTVRSVTTKTSLTTSDPSSEPDGTTVNVTATVTSNHGTPDGYVEFFVNGALMGGSDVDGSGVATTPITVTGLHNNVRAVFDGSTEFDRSTSNTLAFTATTPYHPTLTTSVDYGAYRQDGSQKVTITTKVVGYAGTPRPSGTITADNGLTCTPLHDGSSATTAVATCSAVLAGGGYDVTIDYSGDSSYASATTDVTVYPGG